MKKHPLLRGFCMLFLFMLGFALLVVFANGHLIQTDTVARLTLYEMQQRDDIELAFVGSSIVRDHFNAQLITEKTGMQAFCATVPTASMPASIALTKELLRTNSPEWIVLVTEPYNLETARESTEAQYKLMPFLSDPANMLDYYLRASREDGYYLDRLLMFRGFGAQSVSDVLKTIGLRYFPETAGRRFLSGMDPTISYQGSGFLRHETDERADALIRTRIRKYTDYYFDLLEGTREQLLVFKELCRDNGVNLLVAVYPDHTSRALAEPSHLEYIESLMEFCKEIDVPCYNFAYARPELMPNLDGYFFDLYHMVGEGADILSSAFCDVFSMHVSGGDPSALFYEDRWQYVDAIDFITNAWLVQYDPEQNWDKSLRHDPDRVKAIASGRDVFLADCNCGTYVVPEYRFVLLEEDGSETLLQDYGADTLYACVPGELDGRTLRVYARAQNSAGTREHWYDLNIRE